MKIQLKKSLVNFIGDPHFGKKFNNVMFHRKGEREAQQSSEFTKQLLTEADVCIMVGDLFDTYDVSNDILFDVFSRIRLAAENQPNKEFIMMNGNHDVSRDSNVKTSFEILAWLCKGFNNVRFITQTQYINTKSGEQILICPYSTFNTSKQEVGLFKDMKFDLVVGHWDTEEIAGEHNLVPLELLSEMTDIVVTGHVHTAEMKEIGNLKFYRTGSMLPYAHSEDPQELIYMTRTLEQIEKELAIDPNFYKDKCLRIVTTEGEEIPTDINCLQLTLKKVHVEKEKLEVKMGDFDFRQLFDECFKDNEVPDDIRDTYWEEYNKRASND